MLASLCRNFVSHLSRRGMTIRDPLVGKSHLIRNRQGVENELLTPKEFAKDGPIECQSELGGMLNFYYRKAA